MSTLTFTKTITFCGCECCQCGIPFAFPDYQERRLRENGDTFYCPNGHGNVYTQRKRLEAEIEEAKRQITAERCSRLNAESQRDALAVRASTAEKEAARSKRRHAAGVCPCCNRSFVQLRRHMETKHPKYKTGKEEK